MQGVKGLDALMQMRRKLSGSELHCLGSESAQGGLQRPDGRQAPDDLLHEV